MYVVLGLFSRATYKTKVDMENGLGKVGESKKQVAIGAGWSGCGLGWLGQGLLIFFYIKKIK